jgi:hypothetical protein
MSTIGAYRGTEWWKRLRKLRHDYGSKLIAKGIDPRSLKFSALMRRKFS